MSEVLAAQLPSSGASSLDALRVAQEHRWSHADGGHRDGTHPKNPPANTAYADAIHHFTGQHLVTVAAGATCAYLGDERNLREFLVADETARWLRHKGHTVITFLIDDSMDALTHRQLRVGVSKDEGVLEEYKSWCGKPIGSLPDPFDCHESYAAHFEEELLARLHRLGCHPNLISTARLYQSGVYAPYVRIVLERYEEIQAFIHKHFPGYEMEKLFWPLCPYCGHLQGVALESVRAGTIHISCEHCRKSTSLAFDDAQGKLSWKLDCAARWVLFNIGAEPFSKSYLEPQTGSFVVAQTLSEHFFGGHKVLPLHYGLVKMENKFGGQLLQGLPPAVLRRLLVDNPAADFKITRDLIITTASRYEILDNLSYLDFTKQLLPLWMITPHALTAEQRDLVAHGLAFRQHFLKEDSFSPLPSRRHFEAQRPEVLLALQDLLSEIIELRESHKLPDEDLETMIKEKIGEMGSLKKHALHWMRETIGQRQGLPAHRFLRVLPLDYLQMLEYMLELYLYLHNLNPKTERLYAERRGQDDRRTHSDRRGESSVQVVSGKLRVQFFDT